MLKAARSAIITYHSLDSTGSVISIRPEVFRRHMEALAASAAPVVPLIDVPAHPGSVAITFDDGFANFADYALPVLERLSLPATVFVISGYCGKQNTWPSQPSGLPEMPLMSWSVLRQLPPSITVGAHTVTHPDLRKLEEHSMAAEVSQCRAEIEQKIGRAVDMFAYPYGAVDLRVAAAVRRHFRLACGTRLCFAGSGSDPYLLPRLDGYYLKSARWFEDPFCPTNSMYIGLRRWLREARACISA